jgi:hypothetical protein
MLPAPTQHDVLKSCPLAESNVHSLPLGLRQPACTGMTKPPEPETPGALLRLQPSPGFALGQNQPTSHATTTVHWPCAFRAASTMCARANNVATAAAVSGKRFGSMIDGPDGQLIRTFAGSESGSTSSMLMVSWLIWPEAKGVMGDDGDTVTPHKSSRSRGALRTRTGTAY